MSTSASRRQRRAIGRKVAGIQARARRDGPPPLNPGPAGSALTNEQVDAAASRDQGEAVSRAKRLRQLVESIPEHLRDTDEAKLMVSRVQATWMVPVHPSQAQAWNDEWAAFLESQPEAVEQRARASGLWVPGDRR